MQPPDWCGRHWLKPLEEAARNFEGAARNFEPGVVVNFENVFDVWENWPGGSGTGYMDTLLMTDSGLEALSTLPRNLVVA